MLDYKVCLVETKRRRDGTRPRNVLSECNKDLSSPNRSESLQIQLALACVAALAFLSLPSLIPCESALVVFLNFSVARWCFRTSGSRSSDFVGRLSALDLADPPIRGSTRGDHILMYGLAALAITRFDPLTFAAGVGTPSACSRAGHTKHQRPVLLHSDDDWRSLWLDTGGRSVLSISGPRIFNADLLG